MFAIKSRTQLKHTHYTRPSTHLLVQTTLCQFSCETATYSVKPLKSVPGINQY